MKDEEKNLIENLFARLKQTELSSSDRDVSADNLIQNLVSKQPSAAYYMTQTILVQEAAIKKMSIKIEKLEKDIDTLNAKISNKKSSFLSSFFKTNPNLQSQPISNDNNIWRNQDNILQSNNANAAIPPAQSFPIVNNTASNKNHGFLSSALQTATGVAGGMILGNVLMNMFSHNKTEQDIFDNIHHSVSNHHVEEHFCEHNPHNNFIHYASNDIDSNQYTSNADELDHDIYHANDFDANDDNFI